MSGFLDQFVLKGGPCDGKVYQNSGPKPLYVNEEVRFSDGPERSGVYHLNADGTGTWLEGR